MNNFNYRNNHDDLGYTLIENSFINHYMPYAKGEYVKVYLLGLKYCFNYNKDNAVNNRDIAKILDLVVTDVVKAWEYWENAGLVEISRKSDDDYEIFYQNISSKILNSSCPLPENRKNTAPVPAENEAELTETRIREMNKAIQGMYGSRSLRHKEYMLFKSWIEDYSFTPEAVILLMEYSMNIINDKNPPLKTDQIYNYIKSVGRSFYDHGVTDHFSAENHIKQYKYEQQLLYKIANYINFGENIPEKAKKTLERWIKVYQFPEDVIKEGIDRAVNNKNNPSLSYIDKILSNWYEKGYKTLADVKTEVKPKTRKTAKKQGKNFTLERDTDYSKIENDFLDDFWEEDYVE
jgi:DnaD/phage-associated family protein